MCTEERIDTSKAKSTCFFVVELVYVTKKSCARKSVLSSHVDLMFFWNRSMEKFWYIGARVEALVWLVIFSVTACLLTGYLVIGGRNQWARNSPVGVLWLAMASMHQTGVKRAAFLRLQTLLVVSQSGLLVQLTAQQDIAFKIKRTVLCYYPLFRSQVKPRLKKLK